MNMIADYLFIVLFRSWDSSKRTRWSAYCEFSQSRRTAMAKFAHKAHTGSRNQ